MSLSLAQPHRLLLGLCLLGLAGPLSAAEMTVVVIENDPADGTNHTENASGLPAGATSVLATSLADAIAKIKALSGPGDCVKNLHFRGHGSPGNQSVGDGTDHKVGERIDGHAAEWKAKLKELTFCPGAVIHLWGCNVGRCDAGAAKLKEIADALGVTVRGAVDTVNAGGQGSYTGPIQEAKPNQPQPAHKDATPTPAKPRQEGEKTPSEDSGCDNAPGTGGYGEGNGQLDSEDVGCDGLPGTGDRGEADGLLNAPGDGPADCASGPGEDLGCDNRAGTGDFGEGDGRLGTEDVDGNGFDLTRPLCRIAATRPGPPKEIDVQVQDTGVGLAAIAVLVEENVAIDLPAFAPGSNDALLVTATKVNPAAASRVELQVTDLAGNCTVCDPVLVEVLRATGKPAEMVLRGLPGEEDTVTVDNGRPGLRKLEVEVNGRTFRLTGLADGESRTLDVAPAVLAGGGNVFVLRGTGKPGGSAAVMIWDGE